MVEIPTLEVSPLATKIQCLLADVAPSKWCRDDRELRETDRFEKARETWERVYSLPIPKATLALRCSQPVRSDYVAGGFALTITGPPRYVVELRADGWDLVELTDPYRRGGTVKKPFETLIQGEIAKRLFDCVARTVSSYERTRQNEFKAAAHEIFDTIDSLIDDAEPGTWQRSDDGAQGTCYKSVLSDLTITASVLDPAGDQRFELRVASEDLSAVCDNPTVARRAFEKINQKEEEAGLRALSRALESLES
jgi:hypothetical protein